MQHGNDPLLESLVLVWLATRRVNTKDNPGLLVSDLAGSLAATLELDRRAARAAIVQRLQLLEKQGLAQSATPAGGRSPRWLISSAGRKRALDVLGMRGLPELQRIDLSWVKKVLVLRALGLPQSSALKNAGKSEWLAAWFLAKHHRLPRSSEATPALVLAQLASRIVAVASDRFTLADAFSCLVLRTPATFSLEDFARRVNDAARAAPTGRWLDDRVFIWHVWQEMKRRSDFPDMTFAQFQGHLVTAHKAQLLRLTRGDLIAALPKEDVQSSETEDGEATFHFVRLDRAQTEGARQ